MLTCRRRSSLSALARIDRQLARPAGLSVRLMAGELECCERTVYRHLEFLRCRLGVEAQYDPARFVWRYPRGEPGVFTDRARERAI